MAGDSLRIRVPNEEEIRAVLSMLTRAYVAGRPDFPDDPAVLGRYSSYDTGSDASNWVVLFDGSRPASALRLFMRRVSRGGNAWEPIGGIGNVGTDPDYAGRGLATRVMEAAHGRLLERQTPTAVLVTDIPDFYARLGYQPIPQSEIRTERAVEPTKSVAEKVTPPVPEEIRLAHAALASRTAGRVGRSAAYWDRWIHDFKVVHSGLDFVRDGDAYLIGRKEESGDAYRALEGAGDPITLSRLFDRLARGARLRKMPDDEAFRAVVDQWGSTVEERVRSGIMCAALGPAGLRPVELAGFLETDTF